MQWRSLRSCISTIASSDWNPDHEAPRSLIFRMFPVPDLQAHPSNLHNCTCARLSSSVPCALFVWVSVWVYGCVWVWGLCVCARVCVCVRVYSKRDWEEARWKRRLVVQIASFSGHGTQQHTYGGSCYRVSVCTTTCTLNALIFEVPPLEKTDYCCCYYHYHCIVVSSAIAFSFANMAESGLHSAAAHISGRGTAIKLPTFWLSFAKCRLYLFLT